MPADGAASWAGATAGLAIGIGLGGEASGALSPDALGPDALGPDALGPDALGPGALGPGDGWDLRVVSGVIGSTPLTDSNEAGGVPGNGLDAPVSRNARSYRDF